MTETPWTCLVCNNNHYLHFTSQFRVTFKPYINSGNQRNMAMADKLMYIPNDDKQNCPFCRIQLVVETFEHST